MKNVEFYQVAIIGAGILGLSAAYALTQRGIKTLIVEKESTFSLHASGKNAGMFRQLYQHPKLTEWAYRSARSWPTALTKNAFVECNSIISSRSKPDHHQELFADREIKINTEHGLTPVTAVYTKSDGLFNPQQFSLNLYNLINHGLATFKFSTEVLNILQNASGWKLDTSAGEFQAAWIINAAGAWINNFLEGTCKDAQVNTRTYARHLMLVQGFQDNFMPIPNIGYYWEEQTEWYLRLWDKTRRLVSICDQNPANPATFVPNENLIEQVKKALQIAIPQQAVNLSYERSWHCFRTYTDDWLPIWGEDPKYPRLFWLAAFGGLGMSTSYAAAEDAARYINGEAVQIEQDFLPKRVQLSDIKRVMSA